MRLSRRQLLKGGLGGLAGATLGGLPSAAMSADAFENLALAVLKGINDCLDYRIVGFIIVPPGKVLVIIEHYMPCGLVEITRQPGDSIFFPSGSYALGTVGQGITGMRSEGNFEARVWTIKKNLRTALTLGASDCFFCPDTVSDFSFGVEGISNAINQMNAGQAAGSVCSAGAATVTEEMQQFLNKAFGEFLELAYDSGLDAVNWRTGCRDQVQAIRTSPATMLACPTVGTYRSGGVLGDDLCIGRWGPLLPRQMRFNSTPNAAPAGLAYRALHIAHHTLKTFKWSVNRSQKLQMMYPHVTSRCIKPGAATPVLDGIMKGAGYGDEGHYGYLWWVKVRCVRPLEGFVSCV